MKKINTEVVYSETKFSYVNKKDGFFGKLTIEEHDSFSYSEMVGMEEILMPHFKIFISPIDFEIFDISEEIGRYNIEMTIFNLIVSKSVFFKKIAIGVFISEDCRVCLYLPKDLQKDINYIKNSLNL